MQEIDKNIKTYQFFKESINELIHYYNDKSIRAIRNILNQGSFINDYLLVIYEYFSILQNKNCVIGRGETNMYNSFSNSIHIVPEWYTEVGLKKQISETFRERKENDKREYISNPNLPVVAIFNHSLSKSKEYEQNVLLNALKPLLQ